MHYAGIIFDLDGVICSTDHYHYLAWKALADRLGIPFDEEANHRLRGVSRMESLERLLVGRMYSDAEKAAFAQEKNEKYRSFLHQMTEADLPADVLRVLHALRRAGVKLAIGSSSQNTPLILERLCLANFFDAVVDGNDITHSKPHPEVFLLAAKRLGLPPCDCLVVEDACAGVEAAVNGGFDCAAIGDAQKDARAKYCLERIGDLLLL